MQLIINADDFGMSETVNEAIVDGYKNGILSSTCIMANMPAFQNAAEKLNSVEGIGLGVHLNIIEGKTILEQPKSNSRLYDENGNFNNGFIQILLKSYNKDFMKEVEQEFRGQIEAVLKYTKPDHLDSHVHTHGIPNIFKLVCKLAKEYEIPCVRTQYEHLYFDGNFKNFVNPSYYINLIKVALLNTFTIINRNTVKKYNLKTNDCVIGVGYTSMMNENTIEKGIKKVQNTNELLEVICHPDLNQNRTSNLREYNAVMNNDLKTFILNKEITSFKSIHLSCDRT